MVNTVLGKGLLPVSCQAIIWTNTNFLPVGLLWTNFCKISIKFKIFLQENAFENVVFKVSAILFGSQW